MQSGAAGADSQYTNKVLQQVGVVSLPQSVGLPSAPSEAGYTDAERRALGSTQYAISQDPDRYLVEDPTRNYDSRN